VFLECNGQHADIDYYQHSGGVCAVFYVTSIVAWTCVCPLPVLLADILKCTLNLVIVEIAMNYCVIACLRYNYGVLQSASSCSLNVWYFPSGGIKCMHALPKSYMRTWHCGVRCWKLVKFRYTRDCCKYFFSNRVINRWNQPDQQAVGASSISAFKGRLSRTTVVVP